MRIVCACSLIVTRFCLVVVCLVEQKAAADDLSLELESRVEAVAALQTAIELAHNQWRSLTEKLRLTEETASGTL